MAKRPDFHVDVNAHRAVFLALLDRGYEINKGQDPLLILLQSHYQLVVLYPPGIVHPLQINKQRLGTSTTFTNAVGPFVSRAATKTNKDGWSSFDVKDWYGFLNAVLALKRNSGTVTVKRPPSFKTAAERMAATAMATVLVSNGQEVTRTVKVKELGFNTKEQFVLYISELLRKQGWKCKISGLQMQEDVDNADSELLTSLDRIDSSGHYTAGNLQIVCRFINRWKRHEDNEEFKRLMNILRLPLPSAGHFGP